MVPIASSSLHAHLPDGRDSTPYTSVLCKQSNPNQYDSLDTSIGQSAEGSNERVDQQMLSEHPGEEELGETARRQVFSAPGDIIMK